MAIDGSSVSQDHAGQRVLTPIHAEIDLRFIALVLLLWLVGPANLSWAAATLPVLAPLQEAQRAGWDTASILAQGMAAADPKRFPGIHAWLKDYRASGGTLGKRSAAAPLPKLDVDRLVARNPAFWRAYFEMTPGDPGTMLLHGALLLAGGEASRAAYVLLIARQTVQIDKGLLEAINGLLLHAQRTINAGAQDAAHAAKLHDEGSPAAALARLRPAIEAWPANGLAHYESALALLAQQYVSRGRPAPTRSRLSIHSELAPAAETRAAYVRARQHDPLMIRAYQGDEAGDADVLLVLGKTIRPLWDIIARDTQAETRDDVLRNLAVALRQVGLTELALALGQVVIGREGGYDEDDLKTVRAGLGAVAPAAADPVWKRLSQARPDFARIVMP